MRICSLLTLVTGVAAIAFLQSACTTSNQREDRAADARRFITAHEATFRPLDKESGLAWWNANVSGKDEDFKAKEAAQNKVDAALSDKARFAELKAIKGGKISDPLLRRQIDVLYLA